VAALLVRRMRDNWVRPRAIAAVARFISLGGERIGWTATSALIC